ncbi:COG1361 family protein [Candidatus Laterigemmans baculatus]|uniref:DUF11 domain-containing protein n=1 Tax=Candidatus Laterigemmans baculatus TaxID=2770505 RepID=UPI0013D90C3C|nr:DUF11 domain-containing protein [Candidatus Laterigemmans baculatus]
MHAVKNGIVALGISLCLSSSPATAQSHPAPRPQPSPAPATRAVHAVAPSNHPGPNQQVHSQQVHSHRSRAAVAQAVAQGGAAPGAVRQVAGQHPAHGGHRSPAHHSGHGASHARNSSGFLGGWFGGGESRKPAGPDSPSLLQRLGIGDDEPAATPAHANDSAAAQPDWEGVPYHRPHRSALVRGTAAGGSAPITDPQDPSNRQLSRKLAETSEAGQTSRATANPQIPVPPAEGSLETSRRERPSVAQLPSSGSSSSSSSRRMAAASSPTPKASEVAASGTASSYGALSDTESSRRSGRRVVDPLDAYLDAEPAAAGTSPVRADGQGPIADRGLANGPRVARRPVPAVNNAATSRRRTSSTAEATTGNSAATSMPPSLAAASGREPQAKEIASQNAANPSPAADDTASREAAPSEARAATEQASTAAVPQVNPLAASDEAWQASAARTPTTTPPSATPTASPSAASPSAASSRRSASAPAAPPQLGVRARTAAEASPEPAETVSSVNTQPVNVVAEIPGIRVVTSGPAEIPVRQGVNYEIRVENRGSLAAPGALVRVTLPRWIGVQSQQASRGEIAEESTQREQQLLWQVEGLPAGSTETLVLSLSAAEARQFDVAVEWAVLPQSNIAHVQVLEPKLELVIDGPDKVIFGESQTYKVRVLNPGSGRAENVVFTLSPNSKTPQSQQIGMIPAGKEAHFEVELTARDLEGLQIHGLAVGAAGLESELTKSIDVIAADLEAVLSGPPLRYQASSATYKLEITNRGDAVCEKLVAQLRLPAGVKYEGGLPQASAASDSLEWQVGQLAPGESAEYEFQCMLQETGEQKIAFACEGTAAGAASVVFTTTVETLADLVLSVDDPTAPAPVGQEVSYEIVLRNRGSKAATDVQVLAQFSHDVEPVRVEGATGKVAPGQVVFDPIPRVEPGAELRLTVVAKADKAGLHRFRSEVRSGETLLISEEATRYIELAGERVSQRSSETETK